MPNNFLHPETLPALAGSLLDRSASKPPRSLRPLLVRKLLAHFHETDRDVAPLRTAPKGAPAWARGKRLAIPAPRPELTYEVEHVSGALRLLRRHLRSARLKARDSQLHADIGSLLRGLSHLSWSDLHARSRALCAKVETWGLAQAAVCERRVVPATAGRTWRRLVSFQEIWDVSRGTDWCLRRACGDDWLEGLHFGDRYWVLEEERRAVAMLWLGWSHGRIAAVKDTHNRCTPALRPDVTAFVRSVMPRLTPDDYQECRDLGDLAIDISLGLAGQPCREGRLAGGTIPFRLWADGRRGRYLVGFPNGQPEGCERRLRLATREHSHHGWSLAGMAPERWSGDHHTLMIEALEQVWPQNRRPRHVR
jgi:hypothetical protein